MLFLYSCRKKLDDDRETFFVQAGAEYGGWLENRASAHKNDTALQAVKVLFYPNRSYGA